VLSRLCSRGHKSNRMQFCDIKDASQGGLGKGEAFHWNVYTDVSTQGSTIDENDIMPETNFTITQGTLTMTEYGNSVPFSQKLDNLSEQPVTEIVNKVLKYDATKAFDTAAHTEFNKTQLIAVGSGTTSADYDVTLYTNGTPSGTGSALHKEHVRIIMSTMRERDIPGYSGDDFYCIAHPTTFDALMGDLESVHQYTTEGLGYIMNGEKGRFNQCRFVEQTHIAKSSWANTDWAFFIGEDTVAEAIAVPEEIRGKIPTDYGRSKGIAWYYLGGFGLVHDSAAGYSSVDNARIVKWASAS